MADCRRAHVPVFEARGVTALAAPEIELMQLLKTGRRSTSAVPRGKL